MRLHWAFCLFMLVAVVNGQVDEAATDDFSTASAEQKTTSSDTPSLPSQSSVDTSVKMESPSLPSAADEIDLLAAPEMPKTNDGEATTESPKLDNAELPTTLSPKPVEDDEATPVKEDSEASISLVKNAAEVVETTPESPKEEQSAEDAFGQKTSIEASTSEPLIKEEEKKMEPPVSTGLPEQTTDLPADSKSTETKLSSEAMSTDPFQGNQPQTATEKSKEVNNDDEEVGSKTEDTDLKTSAEPLAPVVKEASAEKTEKPTEHSTDPADLELKERPLVPIVHEQSEEATTALPKVDEKASEEMSSEAPKVPAHEDEMTKEEAKQEDEKMNEAPKEEGEDGMEKTMTETPKSSMEMDKATEMMPKEEGDLIPKEDATEAPNTDSSTPIDSHSTSAAKEETAPSSPMEKENSQPAFVPMPSETVQQSTSHSVGSNEATEVTKPVLLETTTALPTEAIVESEPKILATNAPIEMIEDDKDDMEKVSKSPAERPQFEEPKMETTEKPDSVGIVEKSEPEMKESEESQTDAPANIPTAETHLMTSESAEVHQQSSTTMASEQPRETTDATHSTDEEGLFAGDMHNVFAGHHHTELTTQSVDTMTTQKVEQEPKFAEEITETEPQPEPTAEPKPEPEPKSNDDEPSAIPEPTAEPQPEPTAEPQPEPTAEPEPTQHVHHSHVVHAPENIVTDTMKTPFSLRFTNIDYTDEFKNLNSGAARKLHDQIYDDLSRAFEETLGDNYVGFELLNFRSGSLIVDGRLLSRDELGDPSMVAAKLEDTLQKAGGRLGGNTLDLKSVYVDGIVSKGGAELDQDGSTTAAANTGYIVGGSIAIGVLIMAFIVFAVIVFGVNARRQKSRTLKLKEELSMAEHGRSTFAGGLNGRNNGQGPVNLMSYGNTTPGQSSANGHSTTTTAAANNSPMLLNSTQFSSPQGFQSN